MVGVSGGPEPQDIADSIKTTDPLLYIYTRIEQQFFNITNNSIYKLQRRYITIRVIKIIRLFHK